MSPTAVEITRPAPLATEAEADLVRLSGVIESAELLTEADLAEYTDGELTEWATSLERLRRTVDAAAVRVADEVDRAGRFRRHGFFSAKSWLKLRLKLSGPEAHRRVQTARMGRRLPGWAEAVAEGHVGVEQARAMAQVAANPRVDEHLDDAGEQLLEDARQRSFDEFDRRLRMWEQLADPIGARERAEATHQARNVMIRPQRNGSWKLSGTFGGMQGAEINEILAHFNDAEWRADWADARVVTDNAGDVDGPAEAGRSAGAGEAGAGEGGLTDTSSAALRRSEPQRRADAMHHALLAAATALPAAARPEPTVNIVVDQVTMGTWLTGLEQDPNRYRHVACRTQRGDPLPIDEACGAALWALLRRVVTEAPSTVTDLGRRRRLFTGAARDAVMLLEDRCLWPGCDRPVSWCEADHSLGWKQHGATVPRNGGPMCKGHNLLKERGSFRVWRDADGAWQVADADGVEVG